MEDNLKFNRKDTEIDRIYFNYYGFDCDMSSQVDGMVKCKLIHSEKESLVFPDFLILTKDDENFEWIQPVNYFNNLLVKDDSCIVCSFYIDIKNGKTLKIEFSDKDFVRNFKDNSSLFKCKIFGSKSLIDFATGEGFFYENIPFLKLYHHTSEEAKKLIENGKFLKPSYWNIQGNKKLKNVGYFYTTPLPEITKPEDLKQIAMATDGKMHFVVDNFTPPFFMYDIGEKILELDVYRESTLNRTSTLSFNIDSTIISPNHLLKHDPTDSHVFYEIAAPLIQRIGVEPQKLLFYENNFIFSQENIKNFELIVIGDATKIEGLRAPFDEEDTSYTFKINPLDSETNILEFWFQNANTAIYPNIQTETQEFE